MFMSSALSSLRTSPSEFLTVSTTHECLCRSAAITPLKWRQQRTAVHSLHALPPNQPPLLSRLSFPSGLYYPPQRELPSPSIPSLSSLAFHPREMILGIGGPDGAIRLMGCKLIEQAESTTVRETMSWAPSTQNGFHESMRSLSR